MGPGCLGRAASGVQGHRCCGAVSLVPTGQKRAARARGRGIAKGAGPRGALGPRLKEGERGGTRQQGRGLEKAGPT